MADTQGRDAILGERGHHADLRRQRQAARLQQGDARRDRATGRPSRNSKTCSKRLPTRSSSSIKRGILSSSMLRQRNCLVMREPSCSARRSSFCCRRVFTPSIRHTATSSLPRRRCGRWESVSNSTVSARTAPNSPIEISLSPLETEHGTLVSSAIRDITERKQYEITAARKEYPAPGGGERARCIFLQRVS